MFNLPLPTDNLYKFLALAGLTLVVIPGFFAYKSDEEIHKQRETLIEKSEELEKSLDELKDFMVYFPRHKPYTIVEEPNVDADSREYYQYILAHCKGAEDFARQFEYPLTLTDKQLYLTDPEVRNAFKSIRGLTDVEYEKWLQSLSMLDIQNIIYRPTRDVTQKVKNNAKNMRLEARHLYILISRENAEFQIEKWCIYLGNVLMVLGFGLWWWKVQRYQDKLLKKKVSEAKL